MERFICKFHPQTRVVNFGGEGFFLFVQIDEGGILMVCELIIANIMMPNVDQLNWFPQTKLYPPQVSSEVLHRPRLVEAVHQAITTKRLTLLSAPAGAGKTTIIASIHHNYPDLPLAWLTLDEQDNDLLTFFKVVLAAIQRCFPDYGQTLQMVLDTPAAAKNWGGLNLDKCFPKTVA